MSVERLMINTAMSICIFVCFFFFSSRRRHTRCLSDWSSDVCSSDLKGGSSLWIHTEFPELRGFEWQDGYGAFTVSKSAVLDVQRYIQNQREHHRKMSFQEEYLEFLKKHGIDYDERYLLG